MRGERFALITSLVLATVRAGHGQSPFPGVPVVSQQTIVVRSQMAFPRAIVKGLPYSAEATTDVQQILPNGSRFARVQPVKVYRDREGRTRREQTLALGVLSQLMGELTLIILDDPVAGTIWTLNPSTRVATRVPMSASAADRNPATQTSGWPDARSEALGTREIAGLLAEGTRTVMTVPAGAGTNAQPIEIVTERWVSPELQIPLLARYSDPRLGDTVYQVTKVTKAEPAAELFVVPAHYQVVEQTPPNDDDGKQEPPPDRAADRHQPASHFANGSGRNWKCMTLLVVPLPVSMWNGVRVLTVAQSPLPFQPAFASSMRPSIHFV